MRSKIIVWQACSIKIDEYSHKTNPLLQFSMEVKALSMSHLGVQIVEK
jgi:hypothetical protein